MNILNQRPSQLRGFTQPIRFFQTLQLQHWNFTQRKKFLPSEAQETANFIRKINELWDFINSRNLDAPVGQKPVQVKEWESDNRRFDRFYEFVSSFRFIDSKTNKIDLPSNLGWLLALKSMQNLLNYSSLIIMR